MRSIIFLLFLNVFLFANNGSLKEQLHYVLLDTLPKTMCKEKSIFNECYSVTIEECKKLVAQSVTPCFKKFENNIGENINREQFINIADNIGKCVGDKYYTVLKKENKIDSACYNSSKWIK